MILFAVLMIVLNHGTGPTASGTQNTPPKASPKSFPAPLSGTSGRRIIPGVPRNEIMEFTPITGGRPGKPILVPDQTECDKLGHAIGGSYTCVKSGLDVHDRE